MKIYLVERTDKVGWDETVAQVVIANSRKEAKEISAIDSYPTIVTTVSDYTGRKKKPFVLLTDFNAG